MNFTCGDLVLLAIGQNVGEKIDRLLAWVQGRLRRRAKERQPDGQAVAKDRLERPDRRAGGVTRERAWSQLQAERPR